MPLVRIEGFPLPGRGDVRLDVETFDLLTPDARLIVVDESGEHEVRRPPFVAFRGKVAGDPGSRVTLSLFDGRLAGSVATGDQVAETSRRVLELNPLDFPDAYHYNALANLRLGRPEIADRTLRSALENLRRDPLPATHALLAEIRAELRLAMRPAARSSGPQR